jgi:hypothetical protein
MVSPVCSCLRSTSSHQLGSLHHRLTLELSPVDVTSPVDLLSSTWICLRLGSLSDDVISSAWISLRSTFSHRFGSVSGLDLISDGMVSPVCSCLRSTSSVWNSSAMVWPLRFGSVSGRPLLIGLELSPVWNSQRWCDLSGRYGCTHVYHLFNCISGRLCFLKCTHLKSHKYLILLGLLAMVSPHRLGSVSGRPLLIGLDLSPVDLSSSTWVCLRFGSHQRWYDLSGLELSAMMLSHRLGSISGLGLISDDVISSAWISQRWCLLSGLGLSAMMLSHRLVPSLQRWNPCAIAEVGRF